MVLGAGQFCTNPGVIVTIDGDGFARALADALSAATYAALRWWAVESVDERPDAAIREALEALADLARPPRDS